MSQLMHIKHSCRNNRKYFTEKQTKQHSFNNLERKKEKGMAGGLDGGGGNDKMTKFQRTYCIWTYKNAWISGNLIQVHNCWLVRVGGVTKVTSQLDWLLTIRPHPHANHTHTHITSRPSQRRTVTSEA